MTESAKKWVPARQPDARPEHVFPFTERYAAYRNAVWGGEQRHFSAWVHAMLAEYYELKPGAFRPRSRSRLAIDAVPSLRREMNDAFDSWLLVRFPSMVRPE